MGIGTSRHGDSRVGVCFLPEDSIGEVEAREPGLVCLADAVAQYEQRGLRLTIAGDEDAFPDYVDDLRIQATHRGIGFAGRLDRDEVWQLLSDADLLVVPSLWYETASLAVQEAFAMGTPVIAANHGALAERVVHEKDGLLVPPGDVTELYAAMLRTMYEPEATERPASSRPCHVTLCGPAGSSPCTRVRTSRPCTE